LRVSVFAKSACGTSQSQIASTVLDRMGGRKHLKLPIPAGEVPWMLIGYSTKLMLLTDVDDELALGLALLDELMGLRSGLQRELSRIQQCSQPSCLH
jgi:hypothetical protein